MATRGYLPRDINKLIAWLEKFAHYLGVYGPAWGLSAGEVAAGQADALYAAAALQMQQDAARHAVAWTAFKDAALYGKDPTGQAPLPQWPLPFTPPATLPPVTKNGVMRRITKLVARLKVWPDYNDGAGRQLGIVAVDHPIKSGAELAAMQPVLEVRLVSAGHPVVIWKKKGMGGIELEVDRGDGKGFVPLAFDQMPDYLDQSPLPAEGKTAIWTYRGIYHLHDERVGQWSNPTKITVTGV